MNVLGNVHKIIKFSAVDGPGNRGVIFFQGCNFNCVFCHNPETILMKSNEATLMSVAEVFEEIGSSTGFIRGLTVSGGEASLQKDFVTQLFKAAKEKHLDTFIDSNGSLDFSKAHELMAVTDYVMLDVKSMDDDEHIAISGVSNEMVLKNLIFLAQAGKLFEIRTVISPNMLDCERTVSLASKFIAEYGNIRYKLIKYRPNGVRAEFVKNYKVANQAFMDAMKAIAEANGVKDIVII